MPSDFSPIAQTACVGCGRPSTTVSESGVVLKRLDTYSRAFGCLSCFLKYSTCANCHHERHRSAAPAIWTVNQLSTPPKVGRCWCGCQEYRHCLAAEFDRQFDVHTGKIPDLRCARGCGRYRQRQPNGFTPLECPECQKEYRNLVNG